MWDPIKCDIIQTKRVEIIENVCGYEYIYSKRTLETPFTNTDNEDDIDTVDEDKETVTSETQEENADNNTESVNSHKTISDTKRNVGRLKKVIKNPWGNLKT